MPRSVSQRAGTAYGPDCSTCRDTGYVPKVREDSKGTRLVDEPCPDCPAGLDKTPRPLKVTP